MSKEVIEVTFKNVTKNQEIKVTIDTNDNTSSANVKIDFGENGAEDQQGVHVAYLDVFMMALFDIKKKD